MVVLPPSFQTVGFELPDGARYEDFEDGDHGDGEQHSRKAEQNRSTQDPDHHHERVKVDRAAKNERPRLSWPTSPRSWDKAIGTS